MVTLKEKKNKAKVNKLLVLAFLFLGACRSEAPPTAKGGGDGRSSRSSGGSQPRCLGVPETPAALGAEMKPALAWNTPTCQGGQPGQLLRREGSSQAGGGPNKTPEALPRKDTGAHHDNWRSTLRS